MRKLFILITLLLAITTQSLFAQNSDSQLNARIKTQVDSLRKTGIDTIIVYKSYCIGCEVLWKNKRDRCAYEGYYINARLFWKHEGLTYFTAKDNCFDYTTVTITADSLWRFYSKNSDAIANETIKQLQYTVVENGEKKTYSSLIDHSYRQDITIVKREQIIEKYLDDYNFEKTVDFSGLKPNINYEYNINTKTKRLQIILNSLTNTLAKQKLLSRIN
ncbi:hypothetical protein [Mucilaginibacter flavus]|uniref:hypothetical protein n=1 Tax=Mucilaginibacter flavus TaxID=931504 RepID=UPI0025B53705|nr:hypothetical protein [Mucilaginibacter flavus]MDN3579563.1 hypothetical protein [Mucilaginibacter flavus]